CIRNNSKKPHALGRQTSEREACDRKNCIRNNHSKSPYSNFGRGECEDILDSKRQKKETNMTKEEIRNILDELDDLTLGLNTAENALDATFHFFNKNISTKEKTMLLTLEYDTQSAIFNLAYDCLINAKENLVNTIRMYRKELEEKHE
ncbi:hypothetical protein RK741_02545, partial [Streptococcus pneumoniae]|nr:hypothetical protein [Streptococcus pneumoniae]